MSNDNETTKTEEWAKRVGHELVAEGMPLLEGCAILYGYRFDLEARIQGGAHDSLGEFIEPCILGKESEVAPVPAAAIPDVRDRLTEKACEIWAEDVAREVYGDKFYCVQFEAAVAVGAFEGGARAFAYAFTGEVPGMAARPQEGGHLWLPTRAEACIEAVRAMTLAADARVLS